MTANYEIIFQIEKVCKQRISKKNPLLDKDIDQIIKKAVLFFETGKENSIKVMSERLLLPRNLESSLYIVRLGMQKRALISIDADEIFDKLIITLWGYTSNHEYEKMFRDIRTSIYQKYVSLNEGE